MAEVRSYFQLYDYLRGSNQADDLTLLEILVRKIQGEELDIASKLDMSQANANKIEELLNSYSLEEVVDVFDEFVTKSNVNGYYQYSEANSLVVDIINKYKSNAARILDIGSGSARFLRLLYTKGIGTEYVGEEINPNLAEASKALASVQDEQNLEIEEVDSLTHWNKYNNKFDVVYCNMPFLGNVPKYLHDKIKDYKVAEFPVSKVKLSDWLFNLRVVESLSENGLGLSIVRPAALLNERDIEVRKHLVEQNMIKAVIALPSAVMNYTAIPTYLIIFGQNNKSSIRFVDASKEYKKINRHLNGFSKENLEKIILDLSQDSEFSKAISKEEIEKEDYNLTPEMYLNNLENQLINPRPLSEITTDIIRGRDISKKVLNEDAKKPQAGYLLGISDIQESVIMNCKQPVSEEIIEKHSKYLLEKDDIVLVTRGSVSNLAIVDQSIAEQNVIVSSNVNIIRSNTNEVDPYYLFAYLKSYVGRTMLERISTGAVIKVISNKNLNQYPVPILSLEEMNDIGEEMRIEVADFKRLLLNLKKHREKIGNIFNRFKKGDD